MDYKIDYFEKHNDARGQLVVFLKNSDLKPLLKTFGQIYFVTFDNKNTVRGNHYHKRWREWFGVLYGKLEVTLHDVKTGKKKRMILDGDLNEYVRLEIGPYINHTFRSMTAKAGLLNYTNTQWSPDDTFKKK